MPSHAAFGAGSISVDVSQCVIFLNKAENTCSTVWDMCKSTIESSNNGAHSQFRHFVPSFLPTVCPSPVHMSLQQVMAWQTKGMVGLVFTRTQAKPGEAVINCLDLSSEIPTVVETLVRRMLGKENMYRDATKPYLEQHRVETMVSHVESQASAVFRRVTKSLEVSRGRPSRHLAHTKRAELSRDLLTPTLDLPSPTKERHRGSSPFGTTPPLYRSSVRYLFLSFLATVHRPISPPQSDRTPMSSPSSSLS